MGEQLLSDTTNNEIPLASELDDIQQPVVDAWGKKLNAEAAAVRSDNTGSDMVSAFSEVLLQNSPTGALGTAAAEKVKKDKEEIIAAGSATTPNQPEEAELHVRAVAGLLKDQDVQLINNHLAYFRSLDDGSTPVEELELRARKHFISDLSVKALSDMGLGDKAADIAEFFVPGNVLLDNKLISGSLLDPKEYLTRVMTGIEELPIEEQLQSLAVFFDQLQEDTGNTFKTVDLISRMVDPAATPSTKVDTILDVLDIGTLGAAAILSGARKIQSVNVVRDATQVGGRTDEAADLNVATLQDVGVAESIGMAQITAMSNASGVRLGQNLDPGAVSGLSSASQDSINAFRRESLDEVTRVTTENTARREGPLSPAERASAENKKIEELSTLEGVEEVRIVEQLADETIFEAKLAGESPMVVRLNLTTDAVGDYELSDPQVIRDFLKSPASIFAKGTFSGTVKEAQRVEQTAAKMGKTLTDLQNRAIKDLSESLGLKRLSGALRRSLHRLDKVLLAGDRQGQVFTSNEMRAGIEGVKLSDKEIEAYYKIRSTVDATHILRNWAERQKLKVLGARGVWLDDTTHVSARVSESAESARGALQGGGTVFDARNGQVVKVDDLDLEQVYLDGGVLARTLDPQDTQFGSFTHIIANGARVGEPPLQVLNYRAGYIPKVDIRSRYFVKTFTARTVNGRTVPASDLAANSETVRKFETREEADAWVETQDFGNNVVRVLEDREAEQILRAFSFASQPGLSSSTRGGLFRAHRAEEEIPFGAAGEVAPRMGAFEALSYNVANISNTVSWNTWRLGVEQRLVNTANRMGFPIQQASDIDSLQDGASTVAALKSAKKEVDAWNKVPTKTEMWFRAAEEKLVSKWLTFLPEGAKDALVKVSYKNPVAAAKSAAFNLHLGFFNPIQLFVQANGAAVNMARNIFRPDQLATILNQQTALGYASLGRHASASVAKAMAKQAQVVSGMKPKAFKEMSDLWRRSGLEDSVLTTGDHASVVTGRSLTGQGLQRLLVGGQTFYRAGELFNRRTAFITAYRTWKKKNNGARVNRAAEAEILTDANNLLLEMGGANRAAWQKGVLGVPTQFMQVMTKTVETVLGTNKNFSPQERGKILMTQTALYGAAGVPLGNAFVRYIADRMGITEEDLANPENEATFKTINEGFLGWLTLETFGANVDTGQRLALLNGITDLVEGFLSGGETTLTDMLGAFGGRVNAFWRIMDTSIAPMVMNAEDLDNRDITHSMLKMADIISTFDAAHKAVVMHYYHQIRDSRGRTKVQRDFELSEEIARAIGFRLSDEVNLDSQAAVQRYQSEIRKKLVNRALQLTQVYQQRDLSGELIEGDQEEFVARRDAIFAILPLGERVRAIESYEAALGSSRTKQGRVYNDWLRNKSESLVDSLYSIRANLISTGLVPHKQEGE